MVLVDRGGCGLGLFTSGWGVGCVVCVCVLFGRIGYCYYCTIQHRLHRRREFKEHAPKSPEKWKPVEAQAYGRAWGGWFA